MAATARTASVLLLGNLAGGYLLRTVVLEASGACSWGGATPFPSGADPQAVWDQVEQQLDLIGAMGEWEPGEPTVLDVTGFGVGTETRGWGRYWAPALECSEARLDQVGGANGFEAALTVVHSTEGLDIPVVHMSDYYDT